MLVLKNMTKTPSRAQIISMWSEGTDAEVVNILKKHYAGELDLTEYWSKGDERTVTLSQMVSNKGDTIPSHDVTFVLADIGGKTFENGDECTFQVDMKQDNSISIYMNLTDTNAGGWRDSNARSWINSTFLNASPPTLLPIFKPFKNNSGQGGGTTEGVYETTDTFALRSEVEVLGTHRYSVDGEGSRVWLYEDSSYLYSYAGATLRSAASGYTKSFVYITTDASDGYAWRGVANNSSRICPFGVI